jgi:hypothetical protein
MGEALATCLIFFLHFRQWRLAVILVVSLILYGTCRLTSITTAPIWIASLTWDFRFPFHGSLRDDPHHAVAPQAA